MTEAEQVAQVIQKSLPRLKSGTLRFWGQWFGRPSDNIHRVVDSASNGDVLRVYFDAGEVLTVINPADTLVSEDRFRIGDAKQVRFEWYEYGHKKVPENLRYQEYVREGTDAIVAETNFLVPLNPIGTAAAVEVL